MAISSMTYAMRSIPRASNVPLMLEAADSIQVVLQQRRDMVQFLDRSEHSNHRIQRL